MKTEMLNKKERKQKKSILDPFYDEIKYYYDLGINITAISKIMNEKTPIRLSVSAYRNYILNKIL